MPTELSILDSIDSILHGLGQEVVVTVIAFQHSRDYAPPVVGVLNDRD